MIAVRFWDTSGFMAFTSFKYTIARPDRYIYLPFALLSGKCKSPFASLEGSVRSLD